MCLDMRRYERFYEAKRKAENSHLPLIHGFLGKRVRVKVDTSFVVEGVLIHCELGSKSKPHRPTVLILKNDDGVCILRGNWLTISGDDYIV